MSTNINLPFEVGQKLFYIESSYLSERKKKIEVIFKNITFNENTRQWTIVLQNTKISWDMRYVDIDKISQKIFLTENEADKFIGDL